MGPRAVSCRILNLTESVKFAAALKYTGSVMSSKTGFRCPHGHVRLVLFVSLVEFVDFKPNQLNKLNQSDQLNV